MESHEKIVVREPTNFALICCDCELVHDVFVEFFAGGITLRFARNKKRTAARRRCHMNTARACLIVGKWKR
jgi:hypothetical protein